jgi:uncharacterized membrane protein
VSLGFREGKNEMNRKLCKTSKRSNRKKAYLNSTKLGRGSTKQRIYAKATFTYLMLQSRDTSVDTLRGLAIFTMVAANLAGAILVEPHPLMLRLYGTFAAPLFVLIFGMMVSRGSKKSAHGFRYYLVRMGLTLTVAALIDVLIWNFYPFLSFDVLYLIGFSMPIVYLSLRLNLKQRIVLVASIFALTPVLQFLLGYSASPADFYINIWESPVGKTSLLSIGHHWLIDGWFPIFPWLGVALLGPVIAALREKYAASKQNVMLFLGVAFLAVGIVIWLLYPGNLYTREGYSEMFYPATIGFLLTATGLIVSLFAVVDRKPTLRIYKPLQVLGQVALFTYIFHEFIIGYVFYPYFSEVSIQLYLVFYAVLLAGVFLAAYGLKALKNRWTKRPFLVRFLIG